MPTLTKPRLIDVKLDISKEHREHLVELLNQQLADTTDLYSQLKQAHWNVKGIGFQQVHELFDEQAELVEEYVDLLAERITLLGGVAMGTVRMAAKASTLPEFSAASHDVRAFLETVRDRMAAYAKTNRQALATAADLGEPTTEDLLTEISRGIDKQLYFLESHLH